MSRQRKVVTGQYISNVTHRITDINTYFAQSLLKNSPAQKCELYINKAVRRFRN